MDNVTKNCQNCKKDFIIEPEDLNFYEKIKVPAPTFCPLCRAQRRMAFRNERVLYKRKSAFTGKEIFTSFSPESGTKIYENEIWLSDKWDPRDYGVDYDFSKPFFVQLFELLKQVPLKSLNIVNGVNSPYTFNITDPKNCYLVFNASYVEDCFYCHGISNSKWCIDTSHLSKCENCYEGFWLTKCTMSIFSSQCENSFNMIFSKNCSGCQDCFGCVNLRKKSYCIFNQQYSREKYLDKIESFNLGSFENLQKIKKQVYEFWIKFPNKYIEGFQNTNVSGNYIDHSKEVKNSFMIREGQNLHYCQYLQENAASKDCWDYSIFGDSAELLYECHACGLGAYNMRFCLQCHESVHNLEYCLYCEHGSENLFGCIGLRKKSYCIFNKQYTKEEYEILVPKIRKHMDEIPYIDSRGVVYKYGEFFPPALSPFAYNETIAQEFYPKSKEEIINLGYRFSEQGTKNYIPTIHVGDIPEDISSVTDSFTEEIIECRNKGAVETQCTLAFKIMPEELSFYKKQEIPISEYCPNCRHYLRLAKHLPPQIFNRTCAKC